MEKSFSTGLIASPEDIRDIPLSAIAPIPVRIPESLPPIFDLEILDQNGYPACVGFSCAAIKQDRELREKNNIVLMENGYMMNAKRLMEYRMLREHIFAQEWKSFISLGQNR